MKRYSFIILIFLVPIFGSVAAAQSSDEEYRVYDAVIAIMFAGGKVNFDGPSKVKQLIIRDVTTTNYAYGDDKESWKEVKERLQNKLTDDTIADYESKLKNPSELKRAFDIDLEYKLLSTGDHNAIFDSKKFEDQQKDWSEFYEKFPDSGGHISLSNVGFNKTGDRALVYFVHWCGALCGTGHYILLSKCKQAWKVDTVAMIWIS
jgi:hypothetical protein